ncbi:MAG: hypothetical protein V2I46_05400 [Bacteroides sp.]|jgi:hypothetical protein|nr:hypothetical protein [Bacteroides sp.]
MKKFSALVLIASLILLVTLWATRKFSFEFSFFNDLNLLHWLSSLVKTIIVLLAYIAGFFAMLVITFADIVSSMIWKVEFPLMHLVYDKFFLEFSKGWYWDQFHGGYLFTSGVLILLITLIILSIPDTKRRARYIYNPAQFASRN